MKAARGNGSIHQTRQAGLADGSGCGEDRRDRFPGAEPDRSVQAIADLGGRIDSEALVDGRGKIGRPLGFAAAIPFCESPTRQKVGQAKSEKAAETHLEKLTTDQIGRMGDAQRYRVSLNRSAVNRTWLLKN